MLMVYLKKRLRRRKRGCSSHTDEEDLTEVHKHGGKQRLETMNSRLSGVEEKLNMILTTLPDPESYNEKITDLTRGKTERHVKSLEYAQKEIEDLKSPLKQQQATKTSQQITSPPYKAGM